MYNNYDPRRALGANSSFEVGVACEASSFPALRPVAARGPLLRLCLELAPSRVRRGVSEARYEVRVRGVLEEGDVVLGEVLVAPSLGGVLLQRPGPRRARPAVARARLGRLGDVVELGLHAPAGALADGGERALRVEEEILVAHDEAGQGRVPVVAVPLGPQMQERGVLLGALLFVIDRESGVVNGPQRRRATLGPMELCGVRL
mmetsp:Transcript_27989/g.94257  ORF Transcript_27989/g.94257 Transcript_27989/m.94257 type:complete len:204 (+) Transcript_27989:27-638(+)